MERGLGQAGRIEVVACIQRAVPEVVRCAAVNRVRTALGNDIDDCACAPAVLRCEVREHIHFGNGVDGKNRGRRPEDAGFVNRRVIAVAVIHVSAIQQVIVGPAAGAVHGELTEGTGRI